MQGSGERQELREVVAEASQALARLDANRLEELAHSCQVLNRECKCAGTADRQRLVHQAREAACDMAMYARVLEATRANLTVMHRLRELRAGRIEYGERNARDWKAAEGVHGNN